MSTTCECFTAPWIWGVMEASVFFFSPPSFFPCPVLSYLLFCLIISWDLFILPISLPLLLPLLARKLIAAFVLYLIRLLPLRALALSFGCIPSLFLGGSTTSYWPNGKEN
jgi:hypothetical protein